MTYHVPLAALETFRGMSQETDEVYVLRLRVTGVPIKSVTQALLFAKATGEAFASGYLLGMGKMPYDVRGIILAGENASWTVDVVCTFAGETGPFTPNYFRSAESLATELNMSVTLRQQFPAMVMEIPGAAWLYMAGDDMAGEIAYWLAAPTIYDHLLKDNGAPTSAYGEGKGVWFGSNGFRVTEWGMAQPPPIGPTKPPPAAAGSDSTIWILALGGAAIAYVLWRNGKLEKHS